MRRDTTPSTPVGSRVTLGLGRDPRFAWLLAQLVAAFPLSFAFWVSASVGQRLAIYILALGGLLAAQQLMITLAWRRSGPEPSTPADLLTLARASIGATLVALVVARFTERLSMVGAIACLTSLFAATVLDWLDGPLARRLGPTRLGNVLDIEADSWLTLACALAALTWGGLPWWALLPPLARYMLPVLAFSRGDLPSGGGPWWSRVTGTAQMALLLGALAPLDFAGRAALLAMLAIPVSAAQLVAILALVIVQVIIQRRVIAR